jgi:hypothetical protein
MPMLPKKETKVLLPDGASKSAAHTVFPGQICSHGIIWYSDNDQGLDLTNTEKFSEFLSDFQSTKNARPNLFT